MLTCLTNLDAKGCAILLVVGLLFNLLVMPFVVDATGWPRRPKVAIVSTALVAGLLIGIVAAVGGLAAGILAMVAAYLTFVGGQRLTK